MIRIGVDLFFGGMAEPRALPDPHRFRLERIFGAELVGVEPQVAKHPRDDQPHTLHLNAPVAGVPR